jgi:hypothetical protein
MKKLAFVTSYMVLAVLGLSPVALGQHEMQTAAQADQTNLVKIVREATKQYLDVNSAGAALCEWHTAQLRPDQCLAASGADLRAVEERQNATRWR